MEHLFGDCPQTKAVWDLAIQHNWIPTQATINQSNYWLSTFAMYLANYARKTLQHISFLLWSIWKMRNAVIFQQELFHPIKCLIRAKKLCAEWRIRTCISVDDFLQGSFFTPSHKNQIIRWHPPTPGMVKLNFDGSLQGNSAVGGYIIRDWKGEVLAVGGSNYGNTSVIMAESRALRDGLQAAFDSGFYRVVIEGDNSIVIGYSKKEFQVPWRIKSVMQDI